MLTENAFLQKNLWWQNGTFSPFRAQFQRLFFARSAVFFAYTIENGYLRCYNNIRIVMNSAKTVAANWNFEPDIHTPESAAVPSAEAIFAAYDFKLDLRESWAKKLLNRYEDTAKDTPAIWELVPKSLDDHHHAPWWTVSYVNGDGIAAHHTGSDHEPEFACCSK